jgi:CPA1 family monovalent cation:H+ antiporter
VTVIAWSGMRGVVSLAAALALPLTLANDQPFEHRSFIIFLTFCVILSTLVVQGLSLRPLINLLGIKPDGQADADEQEARWKIAVAVINHIESEFSLSLSDDVLNQIKTKYEIRIQRMQKDQTKRRIDEAQINEFHRIQHELLSMERKHVLMMRREGNISDEALRKIEYELDLEETRLILEKKEGG